MIRLTANDAIASDANARNDLTWKKVVGELEHLLRIDRSRVQDEDRKARLGYAVRAVGLGDARMRVEARANAKVLRKIGSLKGRMASDSVTEEEREILVACVEYVEQHLRGREWEALATSMKYPTPGLRISPDLMRSLILEDTPYWAIDNYKKETASFTKDASAYVFKANVISYFKDGVPKKGPEHVVPFLESEIDWSSGAVISKFMFYMHRYNIDTEIGDVKVPVENLVVNPNPEYEPFGIRMVKGGDGKWTATELHSRTHWICWWGTPENFERTEDGKIKVTAVEDSDVLVLGHGTLFVPKNSDRAYDAVEASCPDLKELEHIEYRVVLGAEFREAREYFERGTDYSVPVQYFMLSTNPKGDPFLKPIR